MASELAFISSNDMFASISGGDSLVAELAFTVAELAFIGSIEVIAIIACESGLVPEFDFIGFSKVFASISGDTS